MTFATRTPQVLPGPLPPSSDVPGTSRDPLLHGRTVLAERLERFTDEPVEEVLWT